MPWHPANTLLIILFLVKKYKEKVLIVMNSIEILQKTNPY